MVKVTLASALLATLAVAGTTVDAAAYISPALLRAASSPAEARLLGAPTNGVLSFTVQLKKPVVPVVNRLSRRSEELVTEEDWSAHGAELHRLLKRDAEIMGEAVFTALSSPALKGLVSYVKQYEVSNTFVVDAPISVALALAKLDQVESIFPNFSFKVNLPKPELTTRAEPISRRQTQPTPWGITNVNASAVYNLGFRGGALRYACADTGVQWNHPAFANWGGYKANGTIDHNYAWFDGVRRVVPGVPSSSSCPLAAKVPCDDNGHGTHVLGTAIGTTGVGVAPGATGMGCRNMLSGNGRPEYYLNCLNWLLAPTDVNGLNPDASLRPHAVGNSYGCPTSELCDGNTFDAALTNLRASGIFMSVSAGNSGSSCSTITDPPATESNTCVVAAITSSNAIATYSSRGPVPGKTKGIDVAAPGSGVNSAYPNNRYASLSGTSMASPHVGGAAILIADACPGLARNPAAIQLLLQETATPMFTTTTCGGDTRTSRPNNVFGWGRINVGRAVARCRAAGL